MSESFWIAVAALSALAILLLQFLIWKRLAESARAQPDFSPVLARIDLLNELLRQTDRNLRDEFSRLLQELMPQL